VTQYAYDGENNVTGITDALGHQTIMQYDNGGQVTGIIYPSGANESIVYQANQLFTRLDRKGQRFWHYVDGSGLMRPVVDSLPDGSQVNYAFDLNGNLTQIADPSGTYTFNYDHMNRLTSTVVSYSFLGARTFTTSYTYDAAGNRLTMTDPEGGITHYTYDTLNRLSNLEDFQSNNYGFGYDVLSRRTSLTRPNSVNTTYAYDDLSHLLSVLHKNGGTTLDGAAYTYDYAGNRVTKTEQPATVTSGYAYDGIYQLTGVTQGTSTTESYSYDLVGNRLGSLSVSPYTYNSSNQMATDPVGSYTYDANGNMLTKPDGTAYTWDVNNRLTQVTLPGTGGTVTFKYDPFGRRVQKAFTQGSATTTTNYVYDGARLLEEVDSSGSVLARYTQGPIVDEPLSMVRSGVTSSYENDAAGSITSLSSSPGTLSATYSYDSYGDLTASTGTITNPFRYTGREFDSETGLYYYRARYFDQSTGRFLSEDPLGFSSDSNFYPYAFNNPIAYTDPSGKSAGTAVGLAGAGTGVGAGFGAEVATGSAGGPIGALVVIIGIAGTYDYYQGQSLCIAMGWCSPSSGPNPTPGPYPSPLDWHSNQAQNKCKNNGCKPCVPPVGTIGYRLDTTGPPHRGVPVPHWHLKVMQQSPPPMCQCQWVDIPDNQGGFGNGSVPTNTVPMTGPAGGGLR